MFTLLFWRETLERAIKTAAQSAILAIGASIAPVNVLALDIMVVLGFAGGGALLSLLTSLASGAVTGNKTPNLTPSPPVATVTVPVTVVPDAATVVVTPPEEGDV